MTLTRNKKVFQVVAVLALVAAVGQVSLGGVVRVSDSGLGCPDWPLCHGQLIPPFELHTLIEYSHRLTAVLVGFLVLALAAIAWRQYQDDRRVVAAATLALVLVVVAGGLGGATVLTELAWWVRLLHLGIAEAVAASIVIAWIAAARPGRSLEERPPSVPSDNFDRLVIVTLAGVLVLVLFGSYMVGRGYGSSCGGWPLCNGSIFPTGTAFATHMAHRYMALLVGILVAWTAYAAWNRRDSRPYLGWAAIALAALFVVQIMVGAITVWTGYAAVAKGLHLSVATLVWTTLVLVAALHFEPRWTWSGSHSTMPEPLSGIRGATP